ncbi:VOC family protein [Candidatus Uabimicrobium amorphum]|uniref:VOC domain-containing protein n=1 Tax=Uabimicrobium amorphum TaxID=2596890 RepID=A0A5S9IMS9_UABAM|nr:hypothetical protein [Candidatus Uabimicrobium amorphum]BBM84407.1 hypothetical protein UABAM_02766 [Candidatus Uabimicrobium amorphum]
MQITKLELHTSCLQQQRKFYHEVLELPIVEENQNSFTVKTGTTALVFSQAPNTSSNPFYHFAFNIPHNQFAAAKAWLASRTMVINTNGKEDYHFEAWNAHAFYFLDPQQNIVEFIARHNLSNESNAPFSSESILSVSEIGLPVRSVSTTCEYLKQNLSINTWQSYEDVFAAMGDENGLFILNYIERPWIPIAATPGIFPTTISLVGDFTEFTLEDAMYKIVPTAK